MIKIHVGDFRTGEEEKRLVNEILESNWVSEGKKVQQFEKNYADFIGTKYCVAVNSGTSALMAGLTALREMKENNLKKKRKIITTPLTYIATTNAIVHSGFEPEFVDVSIDNFGITPKKIREHLETVPDVESCGLILPVHLMGFPCEMNEINKIAEEFGLIVFEDASQSHGSVYNGKKTGNLSKIGAFSFYVAHTIQAGELGALTTNDYELTKIIRKVKANGRMCDCPICIRPTGKCPKINSNSKEDIDPRFMHEIIGFNFKTTDFQAAIGIGQLKRADQTIEKRQENVKYLNEGLEELSEYLMLPEFSSEVSYLAYPLVIRENTGISRKEIRFKLEAKGIESRPLFGNIPEQQPAYEFLRKKYEGKLPNASFLGRNGFYVGCHQYLEKADLDRIIESIKEAIRNNWRAK